jgi:ketosteroid isomerase-like protein
MCREAFSRRQQPSILPSLCSTGLLIGVFFLISVSAQVPGGSKAERKSRQLQDAYTPQIMALLQRHYDALNRHDLDAVLEAFVPGDRTVLMGTGPGQRWQGTEQIKAAYSTLFKDFDEGTLSRQCYWKSGGISGEIGWVAASCRFSDSKQGKLREYDANITGVLEKLQGRWYFASLHVSNNGDGGGR